ncbi:MAG: enoyl-CoA hydratase/isomerase family protein [Betaproteobacteria bacterium]|nr:enoyl-CoA hydratase/isomerase family protein [Betaproteobacteria bacterium]
MTSALANPLLATPARPLPRHIAIIGAGTIGPDIGYYLKSALPQLRLTLIDIDESATKRAEQRFRDYAAKAVARGKMNEAQATAVCENLHTTTDYQALANCDWVLEAATENLQLKRRIFAQVEAIAPTTALITSNTSSLPAARIFSALKCPERATVTHFFAPAWKNPVVEVIDWAPLARENLHFLRWFFCATGKVPLVTADAVCFMLDRIFDNWCNEAALLLAGATAAEIDSVASEFVHAGPFFVLNLARGNPIIVETNTLQAEEEGAVYEPAAIFRSVENWITVKPGKTVPVSPEKAAAIRDRLLGILFSQAVDILDRHIGEPADLDLGCRLALGFRQGPLELMTQLGEGETRRILQRLAIERAGLPQPRRPLAAYGDFLKHLRLDLREGVRIITLCRPEAMNALHDQLTDEILAVLRREENDPAIRGFVITGYGARAFCAGADIGRFPAMLGDAVAATQYARDCSRLLRHLDGMNKPVVAALNGMALGGGLELAMRCHGLVALESAWMQFPEITLGIVPGIGAMVVPYRRWPQAAEVFHGMLRRAEKLKAAEARELHVLDGLARDLDELLALACARVNTLAEGVPRIAEDSVTLPALVSGDAQSASGQALSREVLTLLEAAVRNAAGQQSLEAALEIGYRAFGASACTAAAREGISAFQEGRKPDFSRTG